jgi:hypothetical protein
MKSKTIFYFAAIFIAITLWYFLKPAPPKEEVKEQPIALMKHSPAFNNTVNLIVDNYLSLKDAFVEADTVLIKQKATKLIQSMQSLDTAELKKDTSSVYETIMVAANDVISNAQSILLQKDITEMRRDFSSLTEMMYPAFFNAIGYEGATLYLQNCPMAFNDSEPANWISKTKEIVNPYMGKMHPKYHSGMLHCGDVRYTIKAR